MAGTKVGRVLRQQMAADARENVDSVSRSTDRGGDMNAPADRFPVRRTTSAGYPMVRITVAISHASDARARTVWAARMPDRAARAYLVLTDEGREEREDSAGQCTREIIVADPRDVVASRPARMNLHYGKMELDR